MTMARLVFIICSYCVPVNEQVILLLQTINNKLSIQNQKLSEFNGQVKAGVLCAI